MDNNDLTQALTEAFRPLTSNLKKHDDELLILRLLLIPLYASMDKSAAERAIKAIDLVLSNLDESGLPDDQKKAYREAFAPIYQLLRTSKLPSFIGFIQER